MAPDNAAGAVPPPVNGGAIAAAVVLPLLTIALGLVAYRHRKDIIAMREPAHAKWTQAKDSARRLLARWWPSAPLADGDMLELEMQHPDSEVATPPVGKRTANGSANGSAKSPPSSSKKQAPSASVAVMVGSWATSVLGSLQAAVAKRPMSEKTQNKRMLRTAAKALDAACARAEAMDQVTEESVAGVEAALAAAEAQGCDVLMLNPARRRLRELESRAHGARENHLPR